MVSFSNFNSITFEKMKALHADIIEYYEECNNAYRDAWGLDRNMQLNLGLWKKGSTNLSQALDNLNKEIAHKAEIKEADLLLDAGCGVGGSAIFMTKKYGCKAIGISLVEQQIEKAKENAKVHQVQDLTEFKVMDYCHTNFADNSFDVIIGMESICYAEPKIDFLKEAYRLLRKGGRLVLAENLQAKEELTKKEYEQLYTKAFHACKVQSLDTAEAYLKNLKEAGFSSFECMDYTNLIKPSIRRLRKVFYAAWLYNKFHALRGKAFSKTQEHNTQMCYYLQTALKNRLWSYAIIKAVK